MSGEIEVDESYFGARRVRGKRGRGAGKERVILEDVKCPECGGDIVERLSRRGKFYGCGNYPKCKFVSNYKLVGENCEECGSYLVLKELKKGTFLECPKCKSKRQIEG